jgi:CheY-like chemotaxis protein/anti-sigma regulatory factor (Ser/Thr protein kinase)
MFDAQSDAKALTLARDLRAVEGRVLMLDPDRVRQVIMNLMSNALKFTKEGGVELRARMKDGGGRLWISVRDTGPGIPADKVDQLFRRFSQIDGSNTRAFGGTGLGLAISKALVERMGGEIGVESREGEGSTFWFEIPVGTADEHPTPSAEESGAASLPGVRVLVVDDHAGNRDLAQLFLEGAGAEVQTACGGTEAVETASALPFDIILMDVRMPDMDGPAALAAIRAAPGPNDAAPILAFTANAEAAEVAGLLAQGFDDVVPKPITPRTLLQAVAAAIGDQLAGALGDLPHVA